MILPAPQVGDTVYVDDSDVVHQTYIRGGRATVSEVESRGERAWVAVEEVGGGHWAWDHLAPMQKDLRECYGDIRAGKFIMRPEDAREP